MVLAGHALSDGRLHETAERGQHVDGRVDLPVVQLAVHVDLTLGDVASQIGDRMGDVCGNTTNEGWLKRAQIYL